MATKHNPKDYRLYTNAERRAAFEWADRIKREPEGHFTIAELLSSFRLALSKPKFGERALKKFLTEEGIVPKREENRDGFLSAMRLNRMRIERLEAALHLQPLTIADLRAAEEEEKAASS